MDDGLYADLIAKRTRELMCQAPDGFHVRWMPKLAEALGEVSKAGRLLAVPHSDHHEAHNYRNALLNLAAVALAAMPHVKAAPCDRCVT
jgi:hypothetical protein